MGRPKVTRPTVTRPTPSISRVLRSTIDELRAQIANEEAPIVGRKKAVNFLAMMEGMPPVYDLEPKIVHSFPTDPNAAATG